MGGLERIEIGLGSSVLFSGFGDKSFNLLGGRLNICNRLYVWSDHFRIGVGKVLLGILQFKHL